MRLGGIAACALLTLSLSGCGRSQLATFGPGGDEPEPVVTAEPLGCLASLPRTSGPDWERGRACSAALGDEVGVFAVVQESLVGITAGGVVSLFRFFDESEAGTFSVIDADVRVRGDYVAATATALPFGVKSGDPIYTETVLLRREGAFLSAYRSVGTWDNSGGSASLRLSDRGVVVMPGPRGQEPLAVVATPEGFLSAPPNVVPVAEPAPSGHIAVREVDPFSSEVDLLWLDPCSGETTRTHESERAVRWGYRAWGYRLVYPDDPDPSQLVIEAPEGTSRIALGEKADLLEVRPEGYALLATAVLGRVIVADLNARTSRLIELDLPLDSMTGGSEGRAFGARLTSDGRLFLPMRDASLGYLYVSADGADWRPVGLPIGEVYSAAARESGGTFYLYGDTNAVTLPYWAPAPAGVTRLDHNSIQIAREDGTSAVLVDNPLGSGTLDLLRLSADGGCVSRDLGAGLSLMSLTEGAQSVTLADPEAYGAIKASTFVPGEDVLTWFP